MTVQHIIKGIGAPTAIPPSVAAHYIDEATGEHYLASGDASADDWRLIPDAYATKGAAYYEIQDELDLRAGIPADVIYWRMSRNGSLGTIYLPAIAGDTVPVVLDAPALSAVEVEHRKARIIITPQATFGSVRIGAGAGGGVLYADTGSTIAPGYFEQPNVIVDFSPDQILVVDVELFNGLTIIRFSAMTVRPAQT